MKKLRAKSYKLQASRGFTMTEVIVVVGVLMLLLTVGVGYTQKGGKQIVLFREHAQLTQQILRARSFATQKLRPGQETVCGYGIKILEGGAEYALFKDVGAGVCPANGTMGEGEALEYFKLDSAVDIVDPSHSEFIFSPRDGFVYFGTQRAEPSQEIQIPLQLTSTGQQLIIGVNYLGQVYTE
jgi:type II secretory pathway pseudopilin PulG